MNTHSRIQLHVHDTPPEIFESFARVFGLEDGPTTRWVTFEAEGVQVALFAARAETDNTESEA